MTYGFYIYYRVPAEVAEELRSRVLAMQEAIREETGTTGKLVTKVDEPLLWMEVYEGVVDSESFARTLDRALVRHRVDGLPGPAARKMEVFLAAKPTP